MNKGSPLTKGKAPFNILLGFLKSLNTPTETAINGSREITAQGSVAIVV